MTGYIQQFCFGVTLSALFCSANWEGGAKALAAEPNTSAIAPTLGDRANQIFAKDNLMAWCVVPFDGAKRGPQARAEMLQRLGIRSLVYDYRAEHIPQWEEEIRQLKAHGIELRGWWFPTTLNDEAQRILSLIEKHQLKRCDLWVTGNGDEVRPEEEVKRLNEELERLRPLVKEAMRVGVKVGLYNHGGWFGKPETQMQLVKQLKKEGLNGVGMVYNLHHAHADLRRLADLWPKMVPDLIAVNLNGMDDRLGHPSRKILPLGEGGLDFEILKAFAKSGYQGPIGILNHTNEDAEVRLRQNLKGLERLLVQLSALEPEHFKFNRAPRVRGDLNDRLLSHG